MAITPPLVPATGTAGTSVTVNGSGFTGMTAVLLNGVSCSFAFVSDVQFTFTVPTEGGGAKDLTVQFGATATGVGSFVVDTISVQGVPSQTGTPGVIPTARPAISARYRAVLQS